jgi:hypothetical protein
MSMFHPVDNHNPVIGICMRCRTKKKRSELRSDPNIQGLLVCKDCSDEYDPYRKSQREPENIVVPRPSLDEALDA